MREIEFSFEELPLGSVRTVDGLVCQFEACAWGRATISYGSDDWAVLRIDIDASAKVDGRWVTRPALLERHHPLWKLIADALRERENDRINERIVDDMRECGGVPWNPAVEHSTLNHCQQGIAR
ncbi:hypothetical protein [Methylosinus sp. Ce-a6]|uniref:hypothetical protein n=1 Tax=Methylosinus sp. Ce-a6 TaxID=2172005 RepID=UPI001356D4BD|nr:hypothetical protein [Methylosinus sp. Ce-a6]